VAARPALTVWLALKFDSRVDFRAAHHITLMSCILAIFGANYHVKSGRNHHGHDYVPDVTPGHHAMPCHAESPQSAPPGRA